MRAMARASLACAAVLCAAAVRGEVTRTLSAEIPGGTGAGFSVENLVGRMHIASTAGEAVVVSATVHAESGALADRVRLDRQATEGGEALISVRYPEDVRTLRYPEGNDGASGLLDLFASGEKHWYGGRAYRVSPGHGHLLYVDLEVRVPARFASGRFRNLAGRVAAGGVEGKLVFEVESADLSLERLGGSVTVRGTSGDVHASEISGDWSSRFTSGDCKLRDFRGGSLAVETTSGDIEVRQIAADRVRVRSTSGDTTFEDADLVQLEARSTSGNFAFEQRTDRLVRARVEATSGDARLRLAPDGAFQAETSVDTGDVNMGFTDATVTKSGSRMSWQRGTGGARILVETTSGNITIEPR